MSASDLPLVTSPNDDDYNEDEDEDFNPDIAPADGDAVSSDSEDETAPPGEKRKRPAKTAVDVDFDNSGDEATIQKGKKRRKKGGDNVDDEEEGGEGGLIKTRAQRRVEEKEKKTLATSKGSIVDVNALWAQMAAGPAPSQDTVAENASEFTNASVGQVKSSSSTKDVPTEAVKTSSLTTSHNAEPTVIIKRTYDFAGQTMTEEKTVPAASAEAKLYLVEQARKVKEAAAASSGPPSTKPALNRPKKKASIFGNKTAASDSKGPKLTTLEKSKLDWAAHVDQEGIVEELEEHSKAKDTYLGRLDFLGRMDVKREDELQEKRAKK
jgi:hypothetical protein